MLPGSAASMIGPMSEKDVPAPTNREIIAGAFAAWMNGSGSVTSTFADDMTWEIAGNSAASRKYASADQFIDEVLSPFGARFSNEDPFRPVTIRAVYEDQGLGTVIVLWDGRGTTTAGTVYENTYAWFMTLRGGKVIDGTAFYDSIAFNRLWEIPPRTARSSADAAPSAPRAAITGPGLALDD